MGFNPNRQKVALRDFVTDAEAKLTEWRRERARREMRYRVMSMWNIAITSGWPTAFFPSIGTAIATGCYWLHVVCPACQKTGEADLREIRMHPDASIWAAVRKMSCRTCRPHPPFAKPLGVTRRSWTQRELWGPRHRPKMPMRVYTDTSSWGDREQYNLWKEHERRPVCNLYGQMKGQTAIVAATRAMRDLTGNLMPQPGIFPDYKAPIVRNAPDGARELMLARWGMPSSAMALMETAKARAVKLERKGQDFDFEELLRMEPDGGTTNIRNTASKHWKRWLGAENRCVVPFTSFSEFNKAAGGDIWFAFDESRPLAFFAGLWTNWTSVRKIKEGETTNDLFAFLTTDPNAEVGAIHPKAMPVILRTAEEIETWLRAPVDEALKLQRPLPDGVLKIVARGVKKDGDDAQ